MDRLVVDFALDAFERALPDVAFFAPEREDVDRDAEADDLLVRVVPAFLLDADLPVPDFDDLLAEPLFDERDFEAALFDAPDFEPFELDEVEREADDLRVLDAFELPEDDLRDPDDFFAVGIFVPPLLEKNIFLTSGLFGCNQYAVCGCAPFT